MHVRRCAISVGREASTMEGQGVLPTIHSFNISIVGTHLVNDGGSSFVFAV